MKEIKSYYWRSDEDAVELPGDKECQFLVSILKAKSDTNDLRIWRTDDGNYGFSTIKITSIIDDTHFIVDTLNSNPTFGNVQLSANYKICIRSRNWTELMPAIADVVSVDPVTRVVEISRDMGFIKAGDEVLVFWHSEVINMDTATGGGYEIDLQGDGVISSYMGNPIYIQVYGSTTRLFVSGYYADMS